MDKRRKASRDHLYVRENGILAFRYKDKNGNWKEKYTGTRSRVSAREFRQNFLTSLAQGVLPNEFAKWHLSEAIDYYLEQRRGIIGPRTWKVHQFRLRRLLSTIGNKRLDQIESLDVERYQSCRRQSGMAATTVNKELELLRFLLRRAKLWRFLEEDYKSLSVSRRSSRDALTVSQLVSLIQTSLERPDWEAACCAAVIAANTTCRSWEIKSLRIADVDLSVENPRLLIRRENTKSDAGAREIELNALALWAVRRLLNRAVLLGGTKPEHFLLPANLSRHTQECDPLKGGRGYDPTKHQQSWRTAWRRLTVKAGIKADFHSLRHTAITIARLQGVDISIVKALAGHMDAKMTDYYTHIGSTAKRDAVQKLERAYGPLKKLLGLQETESSSVQ